ncbi:haloacid dehalogenase type II [Candidatus Woesearchaeota archaeon]|nr:haloacid dehalogenase type II [Candidatus Woesearchaeota archaeon]
MNIKAINFDFYGTLVDWLRLWQEISQTITQSNKLKISPLGFTLEWRKIQRQLIEENGFVPFKDCIKSALLQICKKYNIQNGDYQELLFDKWKVIDPFPEVIPTLNKLKIKYKLAICSNSSRDLLDICLAKIPIKFDYIFISDEVKATKPNPKIYQFAIKSFGYNPENVLHIASSQMDVKGASNAGLVVCWINRLNEKRNAEIPEPRFEIYKLDEVLKVIR